jgi:hypothetical protein
MIHPNNNVLFIPVRGGNRDRMTLAVYRDQGAGGIEAQARDPGRGYCTFRERLPDRLATGFPDVAGGLFGVLGFGPPELNFPDRRRQAGALRVENPGPRAAGANVDTEKNLSWTL